MNERKPRRSKGLKKSPPQQEEGRLHDQEKSRSLISSCRRGGVAQEFLDHTTPSAPSKEATLLLLNVAATPPPAEEGPPLHGARTSSWFALKPHSQFDTCHSIESTPAKALKRK